MPRSLKTPFAEGLQSKAIATDTRHPVFLRVGMHGEASCIDLCNAAWEQIEVSTSGWSCRPSSTPSFRRSRGMLALPTPTTGGKLDDLRSFLNLSDEYSFRLGIAWLLAALRHQGPYPILCLQGPQGSAKSTTARVIRRLIDPSKSPLRSFSNSARDLVISSDNSWLLCFDNLSGLTASASDSLCRLATGGGFATRTLYENREEELFDAMRPIVLNGIDDIATRGDLADRSIILTLPTIPTERRRDERRFWKDFDDAHPRIFGAMLDAMVGAQAALPGVVLADKPRMADFALWGVAVETALAWPCGAFMEAYAANQRLASDVALEADIVATTVVNFMAEQATWTGTASDLLRELQLIATDSEKRSRAWPQQPHHLSNRVRRVAEALKGVGLKVSFDRTGKQRLIRIEST